MTTQVDAPEILLMAGGQADFVRSDAPFPALLSGVGGGKTFASCVKAFEFCIKNKGAVGCLTSPTYTSLNDVVLRTWRETFGELEGVIWNLKVNAMTIEFYNGSAVLLRPSDDPTKLLGLNLAFFGMDEADNTHHATFKVLQARLRQKNYKHQGWITTTPRGIRSWLYQRWVKHETPEGGELSKNDYVIFETKTVDNIHLPEGFYESLYQSYGQTKYAAQELEGKFVAFEGQAFPDFSESIHVKDPPVGTKFRRAVAGMDWGSIRPLAIVELQLDTNGVVWVTKEFYKRRCTEREMLDALGNFPQKVFCDPSAKDVIEIMRRYGVGARKARSNDFDLRARLVGSRLAIDPGTGKPGMYISPSCPNLIDEISSLAYAKERGTEDMKPRWEAGLDDHAVDGTAYGLMELDAGPRGRPQPSFILRAWAHPA